MPSKNRLTNAEIREAVTDRIIEQLEKGTIPWYKPWAANGVLPTPVRFANSSRPRPYRGINVLLLGMEAMVHGYTSPYWLTFKQADELATKQWEREGQPMKTIDTAKGEREVADKGGVRKGEKSTRIIFWKGLEVDDKDRPGEKKRIMFARFFNVFNVDQCDRLGLPEREAKDFSPIDEAQAILTDYAQRDAPDVIFGGDKAYYMPSTDRIGLPHPEDFNTPEDFYFTAFHEHVHGTGHETRLNRPEISKDTIVRGDEDYSSEELVAELGAAMLGAHAGIDHERRIANSAAYIKHWLGKLRQDKDMLVQAARKAQIATDHILGTEFLDAEEDEAATSVAA